MTEEIWKDIPNYEGLYQVSNLGNVRSLNYNKTKKIKILTPSFDSYGYHHLVLWKDGKRKGFTVHRLVAEAFIPNPDNLHQINHKDEDKTNNCVDNLEWCSAEYNNNYGTRNVRIKEHQNKPMLGKFGKDNPHSKQIYQYDTEGNLIKIWDSASVIHRELGFDNSYISACARGKHKSAHGFIWKYAS